jgi:hypothetical protein
MAADPDDALSDALDLGVAGASARREEARRRSNRETRTREMHPVIGGALLAVRRAPAHERVWGTGGSGEEATARYLAERCPRALILHDRRISRGRGNVDHIAVVPSGVYVIDSKCYTRRKIRVARPLIGSPTLVIDGRDHTRLVDGLIGQVELVSPMVARVAPDVPVRGVFCFIDGDLPLLGAPTIRQLAVFNRRRLAKHINRDGPLADDRIRVIAAELARQLPPA